MTDFSRLCIHQATFMTAWDFRQCVEGLARHGIRSTAVWRDKLDAIGTSEAARILADNGMSVSALCPGGLFTQAGIAGHDRAIDDNRRWIDHAAAIGASSLVTITGGLQDKDIEASRARAMEGFARLVPHARAAGVTLALEPLHPMVCGFRSLISTLREANNWLDMLDDETGAGIAFDTYALWWEPGLADEIERAGRRIAAFHVSDWLAGTRDVRLDRGMPGDGLIDLGGLRRKVEATGFDGPLEVEIFSSADWWKRDPHEVIDVIKDRYAQGNF